MLVNYFTGGNVMINSIIYAVVILFAVFRRTPLAIKLSNAAMQWSESIIGGETQPDENLPQNYKRMVDTLRENGRIVDFDPQQASNKNSINFIGPQNLSSTDDVETLKKRFWMYFHTIRENIDMSLDEDTELWSKKNMGLVSDAGYVSACMECMPGYVLTFSKVFISRTSPATIASIIHPQEWNTYRHLNGDTLPRKIFQYGSDDYEYLLRIDGDFQIGRKYWDQGERKNEVLASAIIKKGLNNEKISIGVLSSVVDGIDAFVGYNRLHSDFLFVLNEVEDGTELLLSTKFEKSILIQEGISRDVVIEGIAGEIREIKKVSELQSRVEKLDEKDL